MAPAEFPVAPRGGPRERTLALRAFERGVGPTEIAQRLRITRAAAHHLIARARTDRLRAVAPEPRAPAPDDAHDALASPAAREGLGEPVSESAHALAAALRAPTPPDAPRIERVRARALRALLDRAAAAIAALPPCAGPEPLDAIETDLRWATLLAVELVRAERPLIVRTIEERAGGPLLSLPPGELRRWTAAAFRAAADAVARFDPTRGGRLAAPVSLALKDTLADLAARPADRPRALAPDLPLDDWSAFVLPGLRPLAMPPFIRRAIASAAVPGDAVLAFRLRFGWGLGPPLTLRDLQERHGIAPARWWRSVQAARNVK
jgi:hypothetical protein